MLQAKWAQEGLPADALSIDNGAIISAAARWPLMVDPQLQGIRWVIGKETPHGLIILQQSQPKYIDKARVLLLCKLRANEINDFYARVDR